MNNIYTYYFNKKLNTNYIIYSPKIKHLYLLAYLLLFNSYFNHILFFILQLLISKSFNFSTFYIIPSNPKNLSFHFLDFFYFYFLKFFLSPKTNLHNYLYSNPYCNIFSHN